jgi:hypothetical protein
VRFDPVGVRLGVGGLELAQDVVAEVDRIRERLETDGVLREAWDRERARHGSERDHEVAIRDLLLADVGCHRDRPMLFVQSDGSAQDEIGVGAHHP